MKNENLEEQFRILERRNTLLRDMKTDLIMEIRDPKERIEGWEKNEDIWEKPGQVQEGEMNGTHAMDGTGTMVETKHQEGVVF